MNTREKLTMALRVARTDGEADYVATAHQLVCHLDGGECDGGATCSADREAVAMLDLAHETVDRDRDFPGARPHTLDDLVDVWRRRPS